MKKNILKQNWLVTLIFILQKIFLGFLSFLIIRKKIKLQYQGIIERGFPEFTKDGQCTSCGMCEINCPTHAIEIVGKKTGENIITGQLPQKFQVQMLKCIQCGICAEICPVDALATKRFIFPGTYDHLTIDLCQEMKTT